MTSLCLERWLVKCRSNCRSNCHLLCHLPKSSNRSSVLKDVEFSGSLPVPPLQGLPAQLCRGTGQPITAGFPVHKWALETAGQHLTTLQLSHYCQARLKSVPNRPCCNPSFPPPPMVVGRALSTGPDSGKPHAHFLCKSQGQDTRALGWTHHYPLLPEKQNACATSLAVNELHLTSVMRISLQSKEPVINSESHSISPPSPWPCVLFQYLSTQEYYLCFRAETESVHL